MRLWRSTMYGNDDGLKRQASIILGSPASQGSSRPGPGTRWRQAIWLFKNACQRTRAATWNHPIHTHRALTCPRPEVTRHHGGDATGLAMLALTRHRRFDAAAGSFSGTRILDALQSGDFPRYLDDEVEVWNHRGLDDTTLAEGFVTVNLRPVELALDAGEVALADRLVRAGASLPRTRWKQGDPVRGLLSDARALYIAARRQPDLLNTPDASGWTFAHLVASSPLEQNHHLMLRLLKLAGALRELKMDVTAHAGETPAAVFAIACRLRQPDLYEPYRHVFDPVSR